jgi:hypothetical protein
MNVRTLSACAVHIRAAHLDVPEEHEGLVQGLLQLVVALLVPTRPQLVVHELCHQLRRPASDRHFSEGCHKTHAAPAVMARCCRYCLPCSFPSASQQHDWAFCMPGSTTDWLTVIVSKSKMDELYIRGQATAHCAMPLRSGTGMQQLPEQPSRQPHNQLHAV